MDGEYGWDYENKREVAVGGLVCHAPVGSDWIA